MPMKMGQKKFEMPERMEGTSHLGICDILSLSEGEDRRVGASGCKPLRLLFIDALLTSSRTVERS